jgi:hypothetical protein
MIRALVNILFTLMWLFFFGVFLSLVAAYGCLRLVWWLFTLPTRLMEGRKWAR